MALVDNRPRNNLQQHLAWFTAQNPQIPPKGQRPQAVLQTDVRIENIVDAPRPNSATTTVPTLAQPRQQPLPSAPPTMPREVHPPLMPRPNQKSPIHDIEFLSVENIQSTPDLPAAKTIVDKFKSNQHGCSRLFFLANSTGSHTPRPVSAPTAPSTRQTVDLTLDEDDGPTKKEPLKSPERAFANPVSVRKRDISPSKQPGSQYDHQIHPVMDLGPTQILSPKRLPSPTRVLSATQVPDSEGEEEMDHFGEDLNSEDIPADAKDMMETRVSPTMGPLQIQENHIVPESPTRPRGVNAATRLYPSLPSLPSSNSAVTPNSGWNPPVVTSSQEFISL
jgi:hypothetical protein